MSDRFRKPVLEIRDAPLGGAPGIAVGGEIDIATVPELKAALDDAVAGGLGAFVLDLTEVEFVDSSAINILLRTRALLGRQDRALVLICPPGPVLRALEIVGIADLFTTFASRSAAARHLVPAG